MRFYSPRHLERVLNQRIREGKKMYKVELTLARGELRSLINALETGIVTTDNLSVRQQLRNIYRKVTKGSL